ncbi:PhzF family phenazine biosynthesis protein [Owenweeksia hongkongensis]|uniref:PhzF family phenazine biosynthesis protein n=1 Tax=Owenweeksia hongkongensis TaxID=253245 RepID=UPI003A90F167
MTLLPFQLIQVFDNPNMGFIGNTSTVVFLEKELSDDTMQRIAADQLQPATTFIWKTQKDGEYNVRWFAPDAEIGLCGHGSMAAMAYVHNLNGGKKIKLNYRTGSVEAAAIDQSSGLLIMEQIHTLGQEPVPNAINEGLGIPILGFYSTENKHIVLTDTEKRVREMKPDFSKLRESNVFGYAVTAPGDKVDFVSRTLVPHVHQLEDPATGSSHAALFPFWGKKLDKVDMVANQLSKRGGTFKGELIQEKIRLIGSFKTLSEGVIDIDSYKN